MVRATMQVVVTMVVLGAALYVTLSPNSPAPAQQWAPGIIGTLIGYWLRGR
jgi:hypothetical protein